MPASSIFVQIERAEVSLDEPVRSARHTWTSRQSVLLWLSDANGNRTAGEVTPLPGYSPDTLEAAVAALEALTPEDWQKAVNSPSAAAALLTLDDRISSSLPSARFAAGCAVLGLKARRAGVSLSEALSNALGVAETISAVARDAASASRSAVLLDLNTDWRAALVRQRAAGTRCFKLKIGELDSQALSELRALCESLAPEERLRLDANGGLPAGFELRRLAEFSLEFRSLLEFIEEPWPVERLGSPRDLGFPLALDESLWRDPEAAERWVRSGHVHAVVLKPMTLGLSGCRFWANAARQASVKIVISHLFDGAVAFATYRHLAEIFGSPETHMGLGLHSGLRLWADREEAFA